MSTSTRRSFATGLAFAPLAALPALATQDADQVLVDLAARIPDMRAQMQAATALRDSLEEVSWAAQERNRPSITPADFEMFNCFGDDYHYWEMKTFKQLSWDRPKGTYQQCSAWYSRMAELAPIMNGLKEADKKSDDECGYTAAADKVITLWDEAEALIAQMEAIPATSLRGLIAKAQMVAFYHPDAINAASDVDANHKVVNMIARDLLAMTTPAA
jgi:hypothetical protein